jgi:cell shape-determining protein MreC
MRKGLVINVFVVVTAIVAGIAASQKPWRVLQEQRERTAEQVAEMRKSEAKREELLRQEARGRSSIGIEERARAEGWLKPGEIRLESK